MTKWGQCSCFSHCIQRLLSLSVHGDAETDIWDQLYHLAHSLYRGVEHNAVYVTCQGHIYICAFERVRLSSCTAEMITGNGAFTIPPTPPPGNKRTVKPVEISTLFLSSYQTFSLLFSSVAASFLLLSTWQPSHSLQASSLEVYHVVIQLEQSLGSFGPGRSR